MTSKNDMYREWETDENPQDLVLSDRKSDQQLNKDMPVPNILPEMLREQAE